jgi:hypothetical protein
LCVASGVQVARCIPRLSRNHKMIATLLRPRPATPQQPGR